MFTCRISHPNPRHVDLNVKSVCQCRCRISWCGFKICIVGGKMTCPLFDVESAFQSGSTAQFLCGVNLALPSRPFDGKLSWILVWLWWSFAQLFMFCFSVVDGTPDRTTHQNLAILWMLTLLRSTASHSTPTVSSS